jgi:hypothetical protein
MDKLVSVAPLICATVAVLGGLGAVCIRPSEAPLIKDVVGGLVLICGTAWQANRSQTPSTGA